MTLVVELVFEAVVRNGDADKLRNGMPIGVFDREGGPIAPKGKESEWGGEVVVVVVGDGFGHKRRARGRGTRARELKVTTTASI